MIWVRIKKSSHHGNTISLPKGIGKKLPNFVFFQFGLRNFKVQVESLEVPTPSKNSFQDPLEIFCSEELLQYLLIKESLIYQFIYKDQMIVLGPVIGFYLGEQSYYDSHNNLEGLTRGMGVINEIGGLFIAFSDISIDWKFFLLYGLYFDNQVNKWKYGILPFPSVIFRRAFYTNENVVNELKRLTENKVFNSKRFDKWEVYKILEKDLAFKNHLPETLKLESPEDFHSLMNKHEKIILKPIGLSRGRGICFIEKSGNIFRIHDYRDSKDKKFFFLKNNEVDEFLKNQFIHKEYIVQQQLVLASINGAPFDIRLVIGKNEKRIWECSGIECRLAGSQNKITNISRGGQALHIHDALKLSFGPWINANKMKKNLISLAKRCCEIMDKTGEHFAEFGLDFAFDAQKKLWFIEVNVRPVFRGFRDMNYTNYLHIRHMPLRYAATLAGFGKEGSNYEPKI
jgi:glutathione synthase/RimK-type ligase-like ATP-grasp enzyme